MTLDKLLEKDIYTPEPTRKHAHHAVMLSDLKVDTDYFNHESWKDFTNMLTELYPENEEGHVFMVGGIISTWRFFFSKHEFKRLPQQRIYRNNHAKIDQMLEKREKVKEILSEIPKNVTTHIFYDKTDMKNMIEMYSGFVDEVAKTINTFSKNLDNVESIINRTNNYLIDTPIKYDKSLQKLEDKYSRRRSVLNNKKPAKEIKKLRKEKGILTGSIKRTKDPNKINEKQKKLEEITSKLKEYREQYDEQKYILKDQYETEKTNLFLKFNNSSNEKIVTWSERLTNYTDTLDHCINYLDNFGTDTTKEISEKFKIIHQKVLDLNEKYQEFNENKIEKEKFHNQIELIDKEIQESLESVRKEYNISQKYKSVVKRLIPEKTRSEIIQKVKKDYRNSLETLLSETNHKIIVHPFKRNYVTIKHNDEEIIYDVSGFTKLKQNNNSAMRKEAYEEQTRIQPKINTEEYKKLLKELDVEEDLLDKIIDKINISQTKKPRFKVRSNDHLFRILACDLSEKDTEPSYLISLGPFYDVNRARLWTDIKNLETDETKKAMMDGASSGIILLDYTPNSVRFTPMPLHSININQGKNIKRRIHTTDSHNGSGDNRWDLGSALGWLIANDKTIDAFDDTGDTFQSFNYWGSHSERIDRINQIQGQIIQYLSTMLWAEDKVIERTNLKNPIVRIKGNHDRPLDEHGVVLAELISFLRNYPHLMKEHEQGNLESPFHIYSMWKKQQNGIETIMDKLPFTTGTVGHEGYHLMEMLDKEDNSYGRIIFSHKVTMGAPGDKMDPVSRTINWIRNTGRFNHIENKENPIRLIEQGHAHIWEVGMIYNGIYVSAAPSLEAMDKNVKSPYRTDSSFGLKVGFMKSIPGATKEYIPQDKYKPITFEFLHEKFLKNVFNEKVKPQYEDAKNKEPVELWLKD